MSENKQDFEDDTLLLQSMSQYFGKSVRELRDIIDKKEIMSISTYYYLNLRDKAGHKKTKHL